MNIELKAALEGLAAKWDENGYWQGDAAQDLLAIIAKFDKADSQDAAQGEVVAWRFVQGKFKFGWYDGSPVEVHYDYAERTKQSIELAYSAPQPDHIADASKMVVPTGFALVPIEPTEVMIGAGGDVLGLDRIAVEIYSAMIAASKDTP